MCLFIYFTVIMIFRSIHLSFLSTNCCLLPAFVCTSTDQDECQEDPNRCVGNAICFNTNGSYYCQCHSGFTNVQGSTNFTGTNGQCQDINECVEDKEICGSTADCVNAIGNYSCICMPGYTNFSDINRNCTDIDECKEHEQNICGMRGTCENRVGSYWCECPAGYTNYGNRGTPCSGEFCTVRLFCPIALLIIRDSQLSSLQNMCPPGMEHTPVNPGLLFFSDNPVTVLINKHLHISFLSFAGFAVAALVSYNNLESSVNQSFEHLKGYQKDGVKASFQVFSKVVSVVVSNPSTQSLDSPVKLTFRHLEERMESPRVNYTCAYWKVGPDGQEEGGTWSTDGCYKERTTATHTVCSCEHLSSFAVLMALYPMKHTFGLLLATKLGLIISLLCLVACILTFKFCRSIQGTRTTIHLHLCICLFMADLVFLTAISQTKPEGGCRFAAALLHYFFLGVFGWMLLEGVQLYRMVVLVFNATIQPLYLYAFGYGMPLIIVIISVISRPKGYGTDEHCWLSLKDGLIWSFYGPVCLIIIVNVFFFIVTVWKLAQKFSSLNPDLTKLHKIKAFTVTAIAQMCVLGLMWVFGAFLFQEEGTLVPAYFFTILNSLQGALLFIMHCLLSKQVREEYANFFPCICTQPKRKYSEFSSTNPSSSQSQVSTQCHE
uniref:Uncharacterized protein n=1 Tax=Myripristis murdjan TaxID=586833 RepID=A0A668ALV9_9TELE